MSRPLTQREYARLEAAAGQIAFGRRVLLAIVPLELVLVFVLFTVVLDLGLLPGLLVAAALSSFGLVPLGRLTSTRKKVDLDLQEQLAADLEGTVEEVWSVLDVQFVGARVSGQRFRFPHELARALRKHERVLFSYAPHSRIVLAIAG